MATIKVLISEVDGVEYEYPVEKDLNQAGTVAYYYVNGVFAGSLNTNIPTSIVMAPMIKVSAGAPNAAAKSVDVDYYDLQSLYSVAR